MGNLRFINYANDSDIAFESDDGSGGVTEYVKLDGSATATVFSKQTRHEDSVLLQVGSSNDAAFYHNGTDTYLINDTGNLRFRQFADDADIMFESDDGSGGITEYFRLDGSAAEHDGSATTALYTVWSDNSRVAVGTGRDLQLDHNGTDSVIRNETGDLYIMNKADDKDIIFQSDDGSGGNTAYFRLDGSDAIMKVHKNIRYLDNVKATFGNNDDLQIYHNGTHSYIDGTTTGDLYIRSTNDDVVIQGADDVFIYAQGGEDAIIARGNGAVELYYDNAKKLETTSAGITVTGTVTAAKLSTDTVTIVEDAKTDTALMTLTGAGAGTEANVALKLSGTVHGNPIKMKMVAENASGNVTGAGILSYEPDDDNFNIGQSTTHNRMGVSIGNTVTIGDSDIIYQEDVTIKSRTINMTANSNHYEFNGDIMKIGNDTTTRGKLYNYKNGTWTLADKDAEADADGLLAIAVGTNSTTHGMLLRGTITLDYDPGGAGDVLYVGDSGVIQNSAPSGSGDIVRIVGYLLGGTHGNIFFDPDKTFVEVA